jgi:hypothetical protein
MTRNKTSSIKKVLVKIQAVINIEEKYTIYGDKTCEKWLEFLTIDNKIRLFPNFYSAWLIYENENYLVLVNHKFKYRIPSFLQEENLNSGAWVAIIDELDLPLTGDTDILKEILGSEWDTNPTGFKEVNVDTVIGDYSLKDCFTSIFLYKIINTFIHKEELNQITGIVLTESESSCLLPYSTEVLQEFKNTFGRGNKYIPFENIVASYVASDFKFAYLDLYRCIEGLQPLYFLKDFYDKFTLKGKSVQDFYIDFYETTKLEPKLEDSLKKLLASIDINYLYADKPNGSASSYLYKLRNQIVHLRPKQSNDLVPKSIDIWNFLMLDMLIIIQNLYTANEDLLTLQASSKEAEIEATFTALANQWHEENRGVSSTNQMCMHPAYQQIIGMGEPVIPLLLRELEKNSGCWFWALKSISREDPVSPESRGNTKEMTQAWLEWGKQRGYR